MSRAGLLLLMMLGTKVSWSATQCDAMFETGVGSYAAGGSIVINNNAKIFGTDGQINFDNITQNQDQNTCDTQACQATGEVNDAPELAAFQYSGSNRNLQVRYNGTGTATAAEYREVRLEQNGQLTFQPPGNTVKMDMLQMNLNSKVYMPAGEYWIDQLRLEQSAEIIVSGAGTVILYVNNLQMNKDSALNPSGSPGDLMVVSYGGIRLEQNAAIDGFVFALGHVQMNLNAQITGGVTAGSVRMEQGSTITYTESAVSEIDAPGVCTSGNPFSHILISHDGQGLTCEAESVAIKACADATCSSRLAEDIQISLLPADGWDPASAVTIPAGKTVNLLLRNSAGGAVTLAAAGLPTVCTGASGNSCSLNFVDLALDFYAADYTSDIGNQLAESPFTQASLRAVQSVGEGDGKVCEPFVSEQLTIDFTLTCNQPGSCVTPIEIEGISVTNNTPVTLDFNSQGEAQNLAVNYADAGDISLNASVTVGGVQIVSDTARLVVKPASLVAEVIEPAELRVAGVPFQLRVYALGSNGGTLANYQPDNLAFSLPTSLPAGTAFYSGELHYANQQVIAATPGDLFQSASLAGVTGQNGVFNFAAYFSETGTLTLSARDNNYYGSGEITASQPVNLGRFVPAYFGVTEVRPLQLRNSCDKRDTYSGQTPFSYLGYPMSLSAVPAFNVYARNALDEVTRNYQQWQWLDDADTSLLFMRDSNEPSGQPIGFNRQPVTNLRTLSDGAIRLTLSRVEPVYPRSETPVEPFASDASLVFPAAFFTDTDGVCFHQDFDPQAETVCSAANNEYSLANIGGATLYWGRLRLGDSYGQESSRQLVAVTTEVFSNGEFTRNLNDHCTSFAWQAPADLSETDVQQQTEADLAGVSAGSFMLLQGRTLGFEGVTVPPFSDMHRGQVLLELLPKNDPASITWDDYLDFNWNGINGTNNPSAIVTFGQYRGNDRIIYRRESF